MKYTWIEAHRDLFAISRMCRVLAVSRTGYCQWRVRPPSARSVACSVLDVQVATLHAENKQRYGRPRIVRTLRSQGLPVGTEQVRQSLKRQQLKPRYRRPYRVTTDSDHALPVAPNILNRRFEGWSINEAFVGDITYIATGEGWLYLAVVMDLASRRIVGWSMDARMTAELVCQALRMAYWHRKPRPGLLMHTDRGSQYASRAYRRLLRDYGMIQSMSRKADCWDNSAMESFFKTLKVEQVYAVRYETRTQARRDLVAWMEGYYNTRRLHSSIGFQTPSAWEHNAVAVAKTA